MFNRPVTEMDYRLPCNQGENLKFKSAPVAAAATLAVNAQAQTEFHWWHSMTAVNNQVVYELVNRSTASHKACKVVSDLGMLNSCAGLTTPPIASAIAALLFRQFLLTEPDQLVEAPRVDSAGPMRLFKNVLVPLSSASIARSS